MKALLSRFGEWFDRRGCFVQALILIFAFALVWEGINSARIAVFGPSREDLRPRPSEPFDRRACRQHYSNGQSPDQLSDMEIADIASICARLESEYYYGK